MNVHFIAIGGSAMHNLALALHEKGYNVTGSDDEIFEPARGRLLAKGLLPAEAGWFPEKLDSRPDAVILGMHAREDNPELLRAKELGLKIYSYPEYLYEQTRDKKRIVVGGSHGKTSITAMIMHVMRHAGLDFDYMVGAQLEGFDTMVRLSDSAKIAVFEGDEYLTSPIDLRPKFHLYHPHVGIISGIAWDHINVFPTYAIYVEQFAIYTRLIEQNGQLIYCAEDSEVAKVAEKAPEHLQKKPYKALPSVIRDKQTFLVTPEGKEIPLQIFGHHNLMNLSAAMEACCSVGVSDAEFYQAIASFNGAARRLQPLAGNNSASVFYDFAHSPSKLKATVEAVKEQYPERKLIACMELHTFSSLTKEFLSHYKGSMEKADEAYVYFNPHTIEHKKLAPITVEEVEKAFSKIGLKVSTNSQQLFDELKQKNFDQSNLLIMSSGNFSGIDLKAFALSLFEKK
jgi:UDP-N-acetylmuramate: L-alanyl-gamma-D-glutamyl-meso-diaminopimelate ligase